MGSVKLFDLGLIPGNLNDENIFFKHTVKVPLLTQTTHVGITSALDEYAKYS